jgi:hypothetical protein
MNKTGWTLATAGLATVSGLASLIAGPAAGADDTADPAVVAEREATAAQPHPSGYQNPPEVQPATTEGTLADETPTGRLRDLYYLSSVSRSGGYIELAARDNPALDNPGPATTTLRIYGNAAAFRDGPGDLGLVSKFTCTGAGISGITIGTNGASVTGGSSSSTLTWPSLKNNTSVLRQYYTEGGHFRCKASNLTPAKFTRRGVASTNYKNSDTRAEDAYSFGW